MINETYKNVDLYNEDEDTVKIKVYIPDSLQGTDATAVITLINSAGSTESEPILTSKYLQTIIYTYIYIISYTYN